MTEQLYNPGQPYLLPIPGGFSAGCIAHIAGTFSPTASSLIVKFQSGPVGDPRDEIGLCLYGRFDDGILGRNSFTRTGGWGQEESGPVPSLVRGQSFNLAIFCDHNHYKIAMNNQHCGDYNHRTDPGSMTYFHVASASNDVTISCLWIERTVSPAPTPSYQPPVSGSLTYPSGTGMPTAYGANAPPVPGYGPPGQTYASPVPGYAPAPGVPGYGAPGYGNQPPPGAQYQQQYVQQQYAAKLQKLQQQQQQQWQLQHLH